MASPRGLLGIVWGIRRVVRPRPSPVIASMQISVVVPLFNKEQTIQRCLLSIAAQTLGDFEVIIVDDGSTDSSRARAEQVADRRFRVVTQPNRGPGAARNRGLELARGEFVAFLDADDEWHPDFLARNVAALQAAGPAVGAVTSGYIEQPIGVDREIRWRRRGLTDGLFTADTTAPAMRFVHAVAYMTPCTTVARADVLRRLGGFYAADRCVYAEDAWLWCRLLLNGPALFRFEPLSTIHADHSALSGNLPGARPIEPFLEHPEQMYAACPVSMRPLLRDFLAIRAFKTACMLGYWGQWREAGRLASRHTSLRDYTLPYFVPALVARTPLGGLLGSAWRRVRRPRTAASA